MLQRWRGWAAAHRYEGIAALNGAVVMTLELVGARTIVPYFGSSIYVWTAVVGVILAGLSVGYWYGGKLADDAAEERNLALVLLVAAAVQLVVVLVRDPVLAAVAQGHVDLRLRAVSAAVVLFLPVNVLMGMVSPFLAKLKVTSLKDTGKSVGGLYAAGTVGSIAGTFACGYWLISWLGNRELGLLCVLGLLAASLAARPVAYWWARVALTGAAVTALLLPQAARAAAPGVRLVYDTDSAYARIQVLEARQLGHNLRLLVTDQASAESGLYTDAPGVAAFSYVQRFLDAADVVRPKRVLLIGGGAFIFPRLLLERHPGTRVDVVDIDPKLDQVAAKYFGYRPDPRLRVFHEDGRTFLNAPAPSSYDMIFMDAFNSTTPPFQLTTREAAAKLAGRLAPDGVVVMNLISAAIGPEAKFARAELATYEAQFPAVRMGPADAGAKHSARPVNLILAAGPVASLPAVGDALRLPSAKAGPGTVLTDDFAPVEEWTAALQ
jgi:spermidine synthase